jgi:hypothetical protein
MRGKMRPFGCTEFKRCGFLKKSPAHRAGELDQTPLGLAARDAGLALSAQLEGRSATLLLGLNG